MKQYCRTSQKL